MVVVQEGISGRDMRHEPSLALITWHASDINGSRVLPLGAGMKFRSKQRINTALPSEDCSDLLGSPLIPSSFLPTRASHNS